MKSHLLPATRKTFFLLTVLIVSSVCTIVNAQITLASRADGNWNAVDTWQGTANLTGTMSSSTANANVTGSGTQFTTQLVVGARLTRTDGTVIGTIQTINSNTSITLTGNASNTNSNINYRVRKIPVAADPVQIIGGFDVTATADANCASLLFTTATATSLTINAAVTVGVTGTVTLPRPGSDTNKVVNRGIFNAASVAFTDEGTAQRHKLITYNGGVTTITGNITAADLSATVYVGNNATVKLGGALFQSGDGTLTAASTSTVEYNGGSAQTIQNFLYSNLTISGAGIKTLAASLTGGNAVSGNLTISTGGTLDLNALTINRSAAGGTLQVDGLLLLNATTGGQTGSNFPTNYSTMNLASGTVSYDLAAGGQTVYATPTYGTLTLANTSGTQTVSGNLSTTTLNTTAGGTLNMGTSTLSLTNVTNAGTIRTQNTSGTPVPTGKTWGGTFLYDGAGQTVSQGNYAILTLSGSGTKTFGGLVATSGLLTISTSIIANPGALTTHTANTLTLGTLGTAGAGNSFGSTTSTASNKNNTFFTAGTAGFITVNTSTCTNPTITLGTIAAVCQTATSFSIPYTATTGSPNLYSISGTGITTVTDATLPASPIGPAFTLTGTPPSMPFILTVKNSTTGCASSNVNSSVTVSATPTASGTGSQTICSNGTAVVSGITASNGIISWLENGAGSITANSTTVAPTYTAAAGDGGNTVTLTMSVTNNPCPVQQATYTINVNAQPQVTAFSGNSICTGGVGQLTATLTGATPFSITYDAGAVNEAGVTSGTPFNVTPNPGSPGTTSYTILSIQDNNGCQRNSGFTDGGASITVNVDGTWLGTSDNNWFNGANWCGGNIPTASTNVIIATVTNQPTINAGGAVCNNITINTGNTLTLTGSNTLAVSGNWINNGTFTANAGTTVDFVGATQTVTGTTTFRNLTVSSSVSLSLNSTSTVSGVLTVATGKTLIVNAITLTISGSASITGTLRNTSGVVTATGMTVNNGGTYEHNRNGGAIPTASWATGSTCAITGTTNAVDFTSGIGQTFSNFSWTCSSQTDEFVLAANSGGNLIINGTLTVNRTGTGELRIPVITVQPNVTVGSYVQTGGTVYIGNDASNARTLNVTGSFTLNQATTTSSFVLANGSSSGITLTLNVGGNFTMSAGTLSRGGTNGTANVNFTSATTYLKTGGTFSGNVNFAINNGASVDFGTSIIDGSGGTFTNNGSLITANTNGITTSGNSGTIQVGSTRTYASATANYTYNGSAIQNAGNGLAGTINNLTISNTGGTSGVTLNASVTVNGILNFANGLLTTGANTVTIASAGSITNASSAKYVNGRLAKAFTNTTPFTYPIGKGGNYRPVVFNYAANTTKTVTIEQFEAAFPVAIPASVSVAGFGNRYWNIAQSATGTAFTIALNNSGVTPAGTVRMIRSEGGGASSSNATSFSSPNYSNSSTFATGNVSNNVALGETAIPLTINGVTVTATKIYNGNTIAVLNTGSATLSGIVSPDVVTLNSGSAAGAYADKHVGTGKAITVTGFTLGGANAGAYSLPTPNQISGLTADITERLITVTAVTNTKTYDGTTSSAGVPTYTLQPSDATGTAPTQTFDTKHVGTAKTLTASGLVINDGNAGNNYIISYADDNTAEIQVRNITVTAVTDTKDYDGNTSSAGVTTYTLQSGDVTGTAPTQTFDNATVGTGKTLTAAGLVINDGNSGNNYNIGYATNTTGVINQLAVTVTPDAGQFKVFGDANPTYTYTASPSLISPDVFSGSISRVAGEAIGFYAYTLGSLTASSNYSVSLGGSNTFEIQAISQSNADFRSKTNGDFSVAGTWEYDLGGNNWQNASQAPTSANSVSITHDVTLNQNYTVGASKTFALGTGAIFTINPTRTFTVAGNADFDGKPVTIQSDNTGTGSIGQVTGTLSNATDVTVERYIPNNGFRSWRLLSVPTFGSSQTIRQAWQEGNANPLPMQNNLVNRGTQITGVFPTQAAAAAAGFDSTSVQAGMLSWGGTNWVNVTNTNTAIANNQAYFLYIRGERSKGVTGVTSNSSATTLRTNGTIYTGDQVNNINANTFALVPNVYPSSIDFTGLTRTGGVNNLFYIWDSKKQNGSSLGIYQTFSGTNSFNCMVSGGSYTLGQPNTTVESGQAFFVQTNNNAGSITLKETAKTNSATGHLGLRPSTPANQLVKIDTRLYGHGTNNMIDANAVVFDAAYSNDVDGDDAPKFTNPGENIGIQKANTVLAIEGRQPVANNDVVQYKIWNLQQQTTYTLELAASNMASQGVSATLEDNYLNSSTPLDLNGTTSVNFTINSNTASSAANRFRVVFRQLAPVPVNFVSVEANRTNAGVKVNWKSASERGIKNYIVERSADGGRSFTATGTIAAASNNAIEIGYNFMDASAPSAALLYRIKSQGVNNEIRYSPIAKVSAGNMQSGFAVSPNPVENGTMNLVFKNQEAGKYSIRVISSNGETLKLATVNHAGGNSNQPVILPAAIARGNYNVEIVSPDNTKTVQAIMVNTK